LLRIFGAFRAVETYARADEREVTATASGSLPSDLERSCSAPFWGRCSAAIGILTQVVTQPFAELVIRPLGWLSLASVIPMPIGLVTIDIDDPTLVTNCRH
jgi:hypothetical protein